MDLERQYGPGEFIRLLNSSPQGSVLSDGWLRRQRQAAAHRFGPDGKILLPNFVAWHLYQRHGVVRKTLAERGANVREQAAIASRELMRANREIGELPKVVNPARKLACKYDFQRFCTEYFPQTFKLNFSTDHIKVIGKLQRASVHGGFFALAMPRGSGKSTMSEIAAVWACFYGHRQFVALIGADEGHAAQMLDSIKKRIENNQTLFDDFPEVCFPVRKLERIASRCAGQLYRGRSTYIKWETKEVWLPTIEGSEASGAIIQVRGITAGIRGMKAERADGLTVRPSLIICDDPQTDESAKSPAMCKNREDILTGAILGLAEPGVKLSAIMPCTVIRPGDLADTMLDRKKHPEWNGERTKMVYDWPDRTDLWEKYADIRSESYQRFGDGRLATEFYGAHREEMDRGSKVAWPERHLPDELSAIQSAWNLRLQDNEAFQAEYQNDPLPPQLDENAVSIMTPAQIAAKTNGIKVGVVPLECTEVTAMIDVQQRVLFWMVCGWSPRFDGGILAYGTWPDQQAKHFSKNDLRRTLDQAYPGKGMEGAIYAGLADLSERLIEREWKRADGTAMRISRCLVDANWGTTTDLIYKFCRQAKHSSLLLPSHGKYIGAISKPMREYHRKEGDKVGVGWIMSATARRAIRHVWFDANHFKSLVHARLEVAMGDPGCLSLYGKTVDGMNADHSLLADHLTAEYRVRVTAHERTVDEWKELPNQPDNDWLDTLVGCAVGASIQGCMIPEMEKKKKPKRPMIPMSQLQAMARAQRGARR